MLRHAILSRFSERRNMLKPAIMYKDQIQNEVKSKFYTESMLFYEGTNGSYTISIPEESEPGKYYYASVDSNGNLVGYIGFDVELYERMAYKFGIMSFDEGNITLAYDLNDVIDTLINKFHLHRIEWRAVSGNPACRAYDRFCEKYKGNKCVLHDVIRDVGGKYHDLYIYELLF